MRHLAPPHVTFRRLALGTVATLPALLAAQSADTSGAGAALANLVAPCRATAPTLWGPQLCGPIALVDPRTRLTIANRPLPAAGLAPSGSVWVGSLPDSILVANTAFRWHGVDFAMVMLPLPRDHFDQLSLLAHESFHRVQTSLGLSAVEQPAVHLDDRAGRTWLRLEVQALDHALTSRGAAQRRHAKAALAFRAARHAHYPEAAAREDSLEIQEGLSEYTGQVVAGWHSNLGPLRSVRAIDAVMRRPSYVRSFAYATGPAYGLLLDQLAPRWRMRVRGVRSLSGLLAAAVGGATRASSGALLVAMAQPYGYAAIDDAETDRETRRKAQVAAVLTSLVTGPVLRLEQDGVMRAFDPNSLIAMDSLGMAYPTGEFSAPWGRLVVREGSDGALLSPDFRLLRVTAPPLTTGRAVQGRGWTLELAAGWQVEPGPRPGDYRVVKHP